MMECLCGDDGLSSINNVMAFDDFVTAMRNKGLLQKALPDFSRYTFDRLVPSMRNNCVAGHNLCTNNNCNSANHVLKQMIN